MSRAVIVRHVESGRYLGPVDRHGGFTLTGDEARAREFVGAAAAYYFLRQNGLVGFAPEFVKS